MSGPLCSQKCKIHEDTERASKQAGACFPLPDVKGTLLGLRPGPCSHGFFIKQSLDKMHKHHLEQSLNVKLSIFECTSLTKGCSVMRSLLGSQDSFIPGCTLSYLQQHFLTPAVTWAIAYPPEKYECGPLQAPEEAQSPLLP